MNITTATTKTINIDVRKLWPTILRTSFEENSLVFLLETFINDKISVKAGSPRVNRTLPIVTKKYEKNIPPCKSIISSLGV